MSSAVSIPVVGTSVTVGPLHVADAGSNTVTYNGQHVLSGSTATIAIPEDVRVLTIQQHPGQSSWASGQTPTLNPALGVIGPQVTTALEQANGATVTLTYDGTSWYASTVTAQSTATPMGATLPADNTDGDLFILTATDGTNLPGLYFWDGTQWQPGNPVEPVMTIDEQVPAGETISAFRVVERRAAGAFLYEPTVANPLDVFGVAVTTANAGDDIDVVTDGSAGGAVGLVAGTTYYAGPGGTLTATAPTTGLLVVIGYAASATELIVQVGEPLEL